MSNKEVISNKKQLEVMKQYQNILITRIALIQDLIDKESGE